MKIVAFILTALSCQLHADSIRCVTRLGSSISTQISYFDLDENREISRITGPGQYFLQSGLRVRGREVVMATEGQPVANPVSKFVAVNLDTLAVEEFGEAPVASSLFAARNDFAVIADDDFWIADEDGVSRIMTLAEYNQLIAPKQCDGPYVMACDDERIYFIGIVQPFTGGWPWGLFSFNPAGGDLQYHELDIPSGVPSLGGFLQAMCVGENELYFSSGSNIYRTSLQGGEVTRVYGAGLGIGSMDVHAGRLYFTDSQGISSVLVNGTNYRLHISGATGNLDVFTETDTAPSIAMDGRSVSYTGLLESSDDLIRWSLVSPQPASTFEVATDLPRRFFRATDFQNE